MASLFDHIKSITDPKQTFLGDEGWTNWMINRYMSMEQDYVEVVNEIQKNTWQMEPKSLFTIYKDILPQDRHWFKYIKGPKRELDWEVINILKDYFEISKREALSYLEDMSEDELNQVFQSVGYNPKVEKPKKQKK